MSAAGKTPPGSTAAKLIVWSITGLGFFAVTYLAWLRLPVALWHWANAVWWHWAIAIWVFPLLLISPAVFVLPGGQHLIAAAGLRRRAHLRWETVSFLGALALSILILLAFAAKPEWWTSWHWWLWGVAVIGAAAVSAAGRMFCTVLEVGRPKARPSYAAEWKFNHDDVHSPPVLGIAMSGGGIRSAAFNLGVLHALYGNGLLRNVDVMMSAVSGGSYAMSWYLLQPFYAARAAAREGRDFSLDDIIDGMFRPDGRFQKHLSWNPSVMDRFDMVFSALWDLTWSQLLRTMAAALGNAGYYNGSSSGREEYRDNLQQLFQGLPSSESDWAIANRIDEPTSRELIVDQSAFSAVMPVNYRELVEFAGQYRLPYFIFNATVLVQRGYRHMLWPTAFELTAHDLGSDVCGYSAWDDLREWEVTEHIGEGMSIGQWMDHLRKRPDKNNDLRERRWVLMVNIAPAISGAAIGLSYFDPKKRSREMQLKTWTPFVSNSDLGYLLYRELWNEQGTLYVSDGGHCENLGAYALIKRQCQKIIIVDAEHEAHIPYIFDGYSKLKRQLAREMQLALSVPDIDAYLESAKGGSKPAGPGPAVMTGDVKPIVPDVQIRPMSVIYIKLGLDRYHLDAYPQAVSEYARKHQRFPQDPTRNQSFTTEQFVAYRELGRHVARDLDKTLAAMSS